jgi:hypothetical protein
VRRLLSDLPAMMCVFVISLSVQNASPSQNCPITLICVLISAVNGSQGKMFPGVCQEMYKISKCISENHSITPLKPKLV